jgi:adenylate cyclase
MKSGVLGVGVLALALGAGWGLKNVGLGWPIYDALQRADPYEPVGDVVLLQVDASTVEALSREQSLNFPYPRALYGELLQVAERLQAKAVVFDIVFSEPSVRGPEDDEAFAQALAQAPFPVIFPTSPAGEVPPPLPAFRPPNVRLGNVHFAPERDGIYRFVGTAPGQPYSLAETVYEALHRRAADFSGWIRYPRRDALPELPLYNVLRLAAGAEDAATEAALRGRVWIVGYSAAGLLDLKSSPIDPKSPGDWIHAASLNNLLTGYPGVYVPGDGAYFAGLALLLLLFVGALSLLKIATPMALIAWSVGIGAALIAGVALSAWKLGAWIDPLPLSGSVFVVSVAYLLVKVFLEWKERLRFARLVEHSMSADMVELIRSGKMDVGRFAERKQITVLFADLAGFTTLSEQLPPEELVDIINGYLDGVVDMIFEHRGYVDKFIGDAVMALWGAPVADEQSADRALRAGLEFEALTEAYRQKLRARGIEVPIVTRVGLHTGAAVVGNMGAHRRYNYTALGDSVNLASRLEGLGKHYDQLLTVSGDCYRAVREDMRALLLQVDEVVVKGKSESTSIYTSAKSLKDGERATFERAFAAYRGGHFAQALQGLRTLGAFGPARLLAARCEALLSDHAPTNYRAGVWHHDEK